MHQREADRGPSGATHVAARHLLDHLLDAGRVIGYIPPSSTKIDDILEEGGIVGHSVFLPGPRKGFTDNQRARIEDFAGAMTFWRQLLVDVRWGEDGAHISFRLATDRSEKKPALEQPGLTLRERLKPKDYKASRDIGQFLVGQGFMVREPVPVTMLTNDQRFDGYAVMVRYPNAATADEAHIGEVYDKWLPIVVDGFVRAMRLKGEVLKEPDIKTVFVTRDQSYVSSLYDTSMTMRMVVRRERGLSVVHGMLFAKSTYRACRALAARYKKDFHMNRRPMPAWGVQGYTMVMHYRKGAAGKLVDDSYVDAVRKMVEKLMKKYTIQASIKNRSDARSIVVTFYTGAENWTTPRAYVS